MATNNKIAEEEVLKTLQQRLPEDKTAEALRHTLQQLNKEHFATKRGKIISFKRIYVVVAAAAAIIITATLWWPEGDYMDQFGKMRMISMAERGDTYDSIMQQATVYFNQEDFAKALPLLEQAVAADTTSQMALFYLGVARLHTGAQDSARKNLKKVYSGESVFRYEAAFYLALSYAGQKDKIKAIEWLQKIPAGTPVSEKAGKLLLKLQ